MFIFALRTDSHVQSARMRTLPSPTPRTHGYTYHGDRFVLVLDEHVYDGDKSNRKHEINIPGKHRRTAVHRIEIYCPPLP